MSYRFMRIIVMFDLPVETKVDRQNYRLFRRYLLQSGFIMMQESIYCKLVLNKTVGNTVQNGVRIHKPPKGLVQMMSITEKQFGNIEYIVGDAHTEIINSTERYIEL